MDSLIPISHQEVHKFIQEICSENLFLINLCNEAEEAKDRQIKGNNEQFGLIQKQINQTNDTIKVLSTKKNFIEQKIKLMSSAKEKDDEANKKSDVKPSGGKSKKDKEPPKKLKLNHSPNYFKLVEKVLLMFSMVQDQHLGSGENTQSQASILTSSSENPNYVINQLYEVQKKFGLSSDQSMPQIKLNTSANENLKTQENLNIPDQSVKDGPLRGVSATGSLRTIGTIMEKPGEDGSTPSLVGSPSKASFNPTRTNSPTKGSQISQPSQ